MSENFSRFEQGLVPLPPVLQARVRDYWKDFSPSLSAWPGLDAPWLESLPPVWAASEFVARACLADAQLLQDLVDSGDLQRVYGPQELLQVLSTQVQAVADEAALKKLLRHWRRREMVRIAWRDLAGWADLDEVLASLSALADACVSTALDKLMSWAVARDGPPRGEESGEVAHMVVLGLGKLGGGELNFSSDIDLMFAYTEEGEVQGPGALSNHEFFVRLGRSLIQTLSDSTADGFVFRVDMRLRPNGASGPLALSFDAMEQYYQAHGREWERYALIKARQVAGPLAAGEDLLSRLKPFVFRRYLDYGAIEAIRGLKEMIARELRRKGIDANIKLGPGGIREIEFIGQAFQLIRGGREPVLQQRPIRSILTALVQTGDLSPQAVEELKQAYVFLRNTENRIQMLADRQTHVLPEDETEGLILATALGYPNWQAFHHVLRGHMDRVHQHFNAVFMIPQGEQSTTEDNGLTGVWLNLVDPETASKRLQALGYNNPQEVLPILQAQRAGPAYAALSRQGRERLDRLMPLILVAVGQMSDPQTSLVRMLHLVEAIGRRSVYLALLVENPMALSQCVKLVAASAWIADWISQHPVLLDELIDPASLYAPLDKAALETELQSRLAHLPEDDLEAQMEALREFRHGHLLRVAAADVGAGLIPDEVGRHLAYIAEGVLTQSLVIASNNLVAKHGRPRCANPNQAGQLGFAVIAYGKLGSLELGYGSDLDMIFLHAVCDAESQTDGERPLANEVFFARLAQRLIHIITTRTPAGILYPVDTRLRPSGQSGTLVTNLPAFIDYQNNHAWTWEHQALVRARALAGDASLCQSFEAARREILCRPRDKDTLRQDVLDMRLRMRAAQAGHPPDLFMLKQDAGGMIDIEFMVQYWVLLRAPEHPELTRWRDNIHILEALAQEGLLDAGTSQVLIGAYRHYLSIEHRLKLMERPGLVAPQELNGYPEKVIALWRDTFGEESGHTRSA